MLGAITKPRPRTAVARLFAVLAVGVFAVGGCAGGDSAGSARDGEGESPIASTSVAGGPTGSLTIARPQDVRDINPLRQANNATSEVTYQMHEGLFRLTPEQEVVGVLATRWELLDDGLTYRLYLREDVRFHSGAPFNAEAVVWNFERQLKTQPLAIGAGLVPPYSDIRIVDDHTVDITLEEPNGVFVNILSAPLFMIVDPTRYEELEEDYNSNPSGTGPFKFVSWTPDQRVVLEANTEYWDPDNGAGVAELIFEVIPEAAARIIALRNGEVDMVFAVPAEDVAALARDSDLTVLSYPSMRIVYIGLNTVDPILSDVRVRQALGHAMDRDQVIQVIGANGVRADGIGMPGALGFEPTARDFDLNAATRRLDEAGWAINGEYREKQGQRLSVRVLATGVIPGEIESLLVVQSQWKKAGIEMIVEQIENGARFALLNDEASKHEQDPSHVPNYQAWIVGEGIRTGEIGYITERPKCDQGERGWERHCNPVFDAGFAASQQPTSVEERLEGYAAMNQVFFESTIRLPVFVVQSNKAMGNHVRGFIPNANDALNLRGVTVGS